MFYIFLILFSLFTLTANKCININNNRTEAFLNNSYNDNCYDYTLDILPECCDYFLHDQNCISAYNECINYEDYILNNIKHQCHSYNQTIFNMPLFESIKSRINEEQTFLEKPFEVDEGVLTCNKCGSNKTYSYTKQTRGGDESTTVFAMCSNCQTKWKI